ncbi:hypothetical protein PQ455_10515 [Sphingomonas naphthae]|uniref:Uncharacterized protein n=1 Tax=Sphingomonas naphthae TaxID=1813468 RepID=A0ABY7TGI2_9SPHN|nr:hypothetical protein [Sphingomonas naphthae]WCT72081.1 hypothetical protein PQ455_10515 [Sphingomonas naphthae]
MSKKRHATAGQMDLFATPAPVTGPAAWAGIEEWVAAAVGEVLKHDARSREEIAGAMTAAIGTDPDRAVSRWILDAYASPARDGHNISLGRAFVLAAVTGDRSMIESLVERLGGRILWDKEILVAQLGQLKAREAAIKEEIRRLNQSVRPIHRGGNVA